MLPEGARAGKPARRALAFRKPFRKRSNSGTTVITEHIHIDYHAECLRQNQEHVTIFYELTPDMSNFLTEYFIKMSFYLILLLLSAIGHLVIATKRQNREEF
jgi:hypothetical protein